jgi:arylformamidase
VRDDAAPLDGLRLDAFIGDCELRDVSHARERVTVGDLLERLPSRVERVLLRTFAQADWSRWPDGFTAIEPELIDALAARGCRLIGTDAPSVDPQTCKALRSHHAAHRAGMAILEGLVLDGLPEGRYELIALPLPIADVEATPVRAVLREVL